MNEWTSGIIDIDSNSNYPSLAIPQQNELEDSFNPKIILIKDNQLEDEFNAPPNRKMSSKQSNCDLSQETKQPSSAYKMVNKQNEEQSKAESWNEFENLESQQRKKLGSIKEVEVGDSMLNISIFSSVKGSMVPVEPITQIIEPTKISVALQMKSQMAPQKDRAQSAHLNWVRVDFKSTIYYLTYENTNLAVTLETLTDLCELFFKQSVYVPIFNQQILLDWIECKDKDKYEPQNETHLHFRNYLNQFVDYLNKKYLKCFIEVLSKTLEIQKQGKDKRINEATYWWQTVSLGQVLKSIKKMMSMPKTELAKNTVLARISSLKSLCRCLTELKLHNNGEDEVIRKCKEDIKQAQKLVSKLEFLRSFERTEQECLDKMEVVGSKIFIEDFEAYRVKIAAEKSAFVADNLELIEV